ncbi:ATP-dependent RNA helicase dhx37 [Phlyctochytrium bullatum]|nr:ATP-dependent RNA helicase dhx37 [Phlyctochytrium bullatum]
MGKRYARFNTKARQAQKGGSDSGSKKKKKPKIPLLDAHELDAEADGFINEMETVDGEEQEDMTDAAHEDGRKKGLLETVDPAALGIDVPEAMSTKKRKRLEKFIEKQLKKEERVKMLEKLSKDTFSSDLLLSSKSFSRKMTLREKLRQALKEERAGLPQSDASVRLHVDTEEMDEDEDEDGDFEDLEKEEAKPTGGSGAFGGALKGPGFGAALKKADDPAPAPGFGAALKKTDNAPAPGFGAALKKAEPTPAAGFGSALKKADPVPAAGFGSALKKADPPGFGSALKKENTAPAEGFGSALKKTDTNDDAADAKPSQKNKKKKRSTSKADDTEEPPSKKVAVESSASNGVATAAKPVKKPQSTGLSSYIASQNPAGKLKAKATAHPDRKAFYVPVDRKEHITLRRVELPIYREEQEIMEAIYDNDCVVICGETGSGKTTQLPQFLYEAGFGHPDHPLFKGMVGITQPRRVAAVSMAKRVAEELNVKKGIVAYQVRYDASTVTGDTRIKFMTDGILLRELSGAIKGNVDGADQAEGSKDLLLSKYSCIIIDEAHERTIGTDILIGWLSRIVHLRNQGNIEGVGPLKIVIMSATLRVEDFVGNKNLFPKKKPPLVKVEGRQYKVVIHYNRITPEVDYVSEAYKKVAKIHKKLPPGGILVFLTGKSEISALVRKLKESFSKQKTTPLTDEQTDLQDAGAMGSMFIEDEDFSENFLDDATADLKDDYDSQDEEDDEEEHVEMLDGMDEEEGGDKEEAPTNSQLYVLPLYSGLTTAAQMKVFEEPPEGTRLCIVATNVAETSITIPGIRYVVDCGKVKERFYDARTGVQNFQVRWTSKASADQRAGRAGRVGPGHCYRLFSSAVFANYFEQFSMPEIMRIPIEGVVLQMKAMGIANVPSFPFPTPPATDRLRNGENLLMHLGALSTRESDGKTFITELGAMMSQYPISPRYAKMLAVGSRQSKKIVDYLIAIVSGQTVGEIFLPQEAVAEGDEEEDEESNKRRSARARVMRLFQGDLPESDLFTVLRAVGAYSVMENKSQAARKKFCDSNFLNSKNIDEVCKLRRQLCHLLGSLQGKPMVPMALKPPDAAELVQIRQIILAGFPDQIAMLSKDDPVEVKSKRVLPTYTTMWSEKGEVFHIHGSSALSTRKVPPEWIVYEEIVKKEEKFNIDNTVGAVADGDDAAKAPPQRKYLKSVTIISEQWIPKMGSELLLKYSTFMEHPEPRYNAKLDKVIGYCHPNYGTKMWELPFCEMPFTGSHLYHWFAQELLEGRVPLVVITGKKAKAVGFFEWLKVNEKSVATKYV